MKKLCFAFLMLMLFQGMVSAQGLIGQQPSSQGFSQFQQTQDGQYVFACSQQCLAVLGGMNGNDYVSFEGVVQGEGVVGYGFLVGGQVVPGKTLQIHGETHLAEKVYFSDFPMLDQVPSDQAQIVLLAQGVIQSQSLSVTLNGMSFFGTIARGFSSAQSYVPYNPRTINFLEWPKRNGVYVNQMFLPLMLILIVVCFILYMTNTSKPFRRKVVIWGGIVFGGVRLLSDFFGTMEEFGLYKDMVSKPDPMQNSRLFQMGQEGLDFLNFVKGNVYKGTSAQRLAPYPYDFELKYHAYPHILVAGSTGTKTLIRYNPYGPSNPFNFKDPVVQGDVLIVGTGQYQLSGVIPFNAHGAIYLLK